MARSLRFYGDGSPGCLWPIILTQSPSWWLMHCSAKMDASEKDSGRWSDMCLFFDLCRTLPVGGGLLVPCSLPGPPVVKQLMKWLLKGLARMGGFSQCASPNMGADDYTFEQIQNYSSVEYKSEYLF